MKPWTAALMIFCVTAALADTSLAAAEEPGVMREVLGKTADGEQVEGYTLTNRHGMKVKVMTYGATLTAVEVPDRQGKFENVTLHLDSLENYLRGHPLFGSVVGRFANRIAGAEFTLDGVRYPLEANAGKNHIHGGRQGFQRLVWKAAPLEDDDGVGVELTHVSPDGHAGFPGRLAAKVVYRLTDKNELRMEYTAETDKPTHVNLTNHAYWNLGGIRAGNVLKHRLMLNADHYLPTDPAKIPLGELKSVNGTPMDFTQPQVIGSRIDEVEDANYDHCYVINRQPGELLALVAKAVDPASGRTMEVYSTQPGVQLYTAKGLSNRYQADGVPFGPYHGFCLETQHYPDSPNKPEFPSTVLRPGETYREVTVHRFGVEE